MQSLANLERLGGGGSLIKIDVSDDWRSNGYGNANVNVPIEKQKNVRMTIPATGVAWCNVTAYDGGGTYTVLFSERDAGTYEATIPDGTVRLNCHTGSYQGQATVASFEIW